jgi:predicted NBD/HSP70 family sugar kinase
MMAATARAHDGDQERVLAAVAAALERLRGRFGPRVRAAAVAVPGTVAGSRLVHAPGLSWHGVDLSGLWQHYEPGSEFVVGNDATLAGIAESRRAPGFGSGTMLYLHVADGVGGAVVDAGRAVTGATGAAGEFGHMPFGDPGLRCRCGAAGCWNTSIDGPALARFLPGDIPSGDGSLRHVLASARAGDPDALSAVHAVASSIGRGVAGLVNGLDPHLVVAGGLGPELLRLADHRRLPRRADGLSRNAAAAHRRGQARRRRAAARRGRRGVHPAAHRRGPASVGRPRTGRRQTGITRAALPLSEVRHSFFSVLDGT